MQFSAMIEPDKCHIYHQKWQITVWLDRARFWPYYCSEYSKTTTLTSRTNLVSCFVSFNLCCKNGFDDSQARFLLCWAVNFLIGSTQQKYCDRDSWSWIVQTGSPNTNHQCTHRLVSQHDHHHISHWVHVWPPCRCPLTEAHCQHV